MKRDQEQAEALLRFLNDHGRTCDERSNDYFPLVSAMTDTQKEILTVCLQDAFMLLRKNAQYGDSALNPVRVFSQADPAEQILVRLDDKMSRVAQSGLHGGDDGEDTAADIRGYLVLEEIAHRRRQKS